MPAHFFSCIAKVAVNRFNGECWQERAGAFNKVNFFFPVGREHICWVGVIGIHLFNMSATYSIKTVIRIPVSMDKAWDFFSRPDNLQQITPDHLGFQIISQHHGSQMYAGQIIEYKVKPLLGIPLYWMTEITQAVDRKYFIDEQRVGPYSMWHHQHHFKEITGGVEMTDIVHYRLPMFFLGDIAHILFVRRQLEHIFSYRTQRVESIFGKWTDSAE